MVHAIIFDMDGVIVDNSLYHIQSWRSFFEKYNKKLKGSELQKWIFGRTNIETIKYVFGDGLNAEDIHRLAAEKERFYRQLYSKKIKARDGLIDFLKNLKSNNMKTGIATSAPRKNVDFILDSLAIRKYFDAIIDAEKVQKK